MRILKDGVTFLSKPYHRLMDMMYRNKTLPEQWKVARIVPLHKKGAKNDLKNYRPISNLCVASKIFEKCILRRIEDLAERGDLFTNKQHRFRKKSTITAARCLPQQIARAIDDNQYFAVASMDLSSAFDVVNIELLLERLSITGLPQDVIGLLSLWLTKCEAYVEMEGSAQHSSKSKLEQFRGLYLD
jgi:hypothetical protein